jgi:hypothetical protein
MAVGEQAEPGGRGDEFNLFVFLDDLLHLFGNHIGTLQGGRIRQLDVDHEVSHVLFGHEPAGDQFAHISHGRRGRSDENGRW